MQKDEALRLLRNPDLISPARATLLANIAAEARSLGMACYLVGGSVRDLLLGRPVKDLDVIVEGDAIRLGEQLKKVHGGEFTPHFKFRTAFWRSPELDEVVDLITARSEAYEHPGALPSVSPSTIQDDLWRRDFTINAMSIRLDGENIGEFLDPLGGREDLANKLIRVLHAKSFVDDPTRMFRAVRYEARYGFSIEPQTLALINDEAFKVIERVSGERLRNELELILGEAAFQQALRRLGEVGLLKAVHPRMPEFSPDYVDFLEMDIRLDVPADRRAMGFILWFMDLSEEEVFLLSNRFDFSNELALYVWAAAQLKRSLPQLLGSPPSVWTYALEKLPLLSIYGVYLVSHENALLSYISLWRHVKPRISGGDLKSRGLPPGPRYAEILTRLRSAWLDGEVASPEEEEWLLGKLL